MKTFQDLEFEQINDAPFMVGKKTRMHFDNGYGVSVVRFKRPISKTYSSYTSNENEWEVAVLYGDENEWEITYNTHITDDVLGYLTEGEINWIMVQIQEL